MNRCRRGLRAATTPVTVLAVVLVVSIAALASLPLRSQLSETREEATEAHLLAYGTKLVREISSCMLLDAVTGDNCSFVLVFPQAVHIKTSLRYVNITLLNAGAGGASEKLVIDLERLRRSLSYVLWAKHGATLSSIVPSGDNDCRTSMTRVTVGLSFTIRSEARLELNIKCMYK